MHAISGYINRSRFVERGRRCPCPYSGQPISYSRQLNRDVDTSDGTPRPSHQLQWVSTHHHHLCPRMPTPHPPRSSEAPSQLLSSKHFQLCRTLSTVPWRKYAQRPSPVAGQESYFISTCKNTNLILRAKLDLLSSSWDLPT